MPVLDDRNTPHHQVLINQSILKRMKEDIDELKSDIKEIKDILKFINEYTIKKKEREDARWF